MGICLFNRAAGRGGYALPPGATTYLPQAQRLQRDLARLRDELGAEVGGREGAGRGVVLLEEEGRQGKHGC